MNIRGFIFVFVFICICLSTCSSWSNTLSRLVWWLFHLENATFETFYHKKSYENMELGTDLMETKKKFKFYPHLMNIWKKSDEEINRKKKLSSPQAKKLWVHVCVHHSRHPSPAWNRFNIRQILQ